MNDIISTQQAVELSGFSRSYLYKLSSRNKITAYKPTNGKLFFKKQDIESFLLGKPKREAADGRAHGN